MNCYKCATPLPDQSRFCMACGADVSGEGHAHSQTLNIEPDPELLAALQAELGSDYAVERELGRGGMAIVYLGRDNHLGRQVAIKLLPPALTFGSGPAFIERFKREARTAATLDHAHIIPVYRVSTGGKLFWYVMKYLKGESLDVRLKRDGPLSVGETAEILLQVADALDYAHQSNVVHRDVKPANFMMDPRGRVTVTDFGIAKALDTSSLTGSGATIGTPYYMAPEQCTGVGVSGASDQYALGITVFQILGGQVPFSSDSVLELMRMHTDDAPPPLESLRPDLPVAVIEAVERALAKDPQDRFHSCMDFARELQRVAHDPAASAVRSTGLRRQHTFETRRARKGPQRVGPAGPGAPTVTVNDAPRRSKRGTILGVSVFTLVAAAIVAGYFALQNGAPAPQQQPVASAPAPAAAAISETAPTQDSTTPPQAVLASRTDSTPAAPQGSLAPPSETSTRPPVREQPAPRVQTPPPAPAAPGRITVGSRPTSAISINGRAMPRNPVLNEEVPAGRVSIRFTVTDSNGVWSVDTVITVRAGQTLNLGRVPLNRP